MSDQTTQNRRLRDRLNPLAMSLRYKLGAIGLVLLAALPQFIDASMALTLAGAYFFGVYAMSWDVVSGYTGQISFGHGVFFGVGGYTSALLNLGHGIDPLLSIPVGVLMAAVAGIIIGVPALRLQGPYLSLVTLIAPLILVQLFIYRSDIFNGEQGLSGTDALFGLSTFGDETLFYYIAFGLFVFVLGLLMLITRTDAGPVFTAIREDEDAVAALGLNAAKFKISAFVLSAAVGGLAGAMIVHTPNGNASPTTLLSITLNVEVIIAAILGGMGTIVGAAIGGVALILLRDQLTGIALEVPVFGVPVSEIDFLLFSIITLILLFALPGGMVRWAVGIGGWVVGTVTGSEPDVATDGGKKTPPEQVYEKYTREIRELFGGDDNER